MVFAKFSPNTEEREHDRARKFQGYPNPQLTFSEEHTPTYTGDWTVTEVINVSSRSTVYLGHSNSTPSESVILKIGELQVIAREAHRYTALAALQGRVIPNMVAFMRGCVEGTDSDEMGVLILEHSGTALDIAFSYLPHFERYVYLICLPLHH
jgi:hypothetical protein